MANLKARIERLETSGNGRHAGFIIDDLTLDWWEFLLEWVNLARRAGGFDAAMEWISQAEQGMAVPEEWRGLYDDVHTPGFRLRVTFERATSMRIADDDNAICSALNTLIEQPSIMLHEFLRLAVENGLGEPGLGTFSIRS